MTAPYNNVRTSDSISTIQLRLYVRQRTFEAKAAIRQIHLLLESLQGSYQLQVLDVEEYPNLAAEDQVPVTPMLVRLNPLPILWISMPQQNNDALKLELFAPSADSEDPSNAGPDR